MSNTEIQFGNYTAEQRIDGYYLRHSNDEGAMATPAEVVLIKELIEGREEWAAMKTVADAAADTAFKAAMEFMEFRQAIARALPKTWYADAPLEQRVKLLVDQWQKLHRREQQVADALVTLRADLAETIAAPQNFSVPALQKAINRDLDTTIAALGLPEPTAKELMQFRQTIADALAALRAKLLTGEIMLGSNDDQKDMLQGLDTIIETIQAAKMPPARIINNGLSD